MQWLSHVGLVVLAFLPVHYTQAPQELNEECSHELSSNVAPSIEIRDGETIYRDIKKNQTHRYFYRNFNVTTMNQPDKYRKLIINLEPCKGVVYLFIRKTRRCYPNPYSCIDLTPGYEQRYPSLCTWTHFMSEIDGRRDGAPTFFEVPLSSTKWFISVFAATDAAYTLTTLADIGALPRPGNFGQIRARQLKALQVQLQWEQAVFTPVGISSTKAYWVYSTLLLDHDNRTNPAVFLRPTKVLNTACGLRNNTDRHYDRLPQAVCKSGKCNATIDGVITNKRYAFNVIVESQRGHVMAYSGIIMSTDWQTVEAVTSNKNIIVLGGVVGGVLGLVALVYAVLLGLYGTF